MSEKNAADTNSEDNYRFPDIMGQLPVLTSYDKGWRNVNVETLHQPAGESPEFCLNHDILGINIGCYFWSDRVLDGTLQQSHLFPGSITFSSKNYPQIYRWDRGFQALTVNLNPELLKQNAVELFETNCVELIPHFVIQDQLIYQIGLAFQAELKSQGGSSRLYAESLANTLAIHLLKRYSNQAHRTISYIGGLPQYKLKLAIDYINDHLEQEVSLGELAAIAQLSQHHFCRAFKQATGLSPHKYLIQQRVERAKQLLRSGKMRISEVAISCGFTHQSHLHRHFKRLTGVTPKAWLNS